MRYVLYKQSISVFSQNLSQSIIPISALLTSPLMGLYIMQYEEMSWNDIIIDQLIGAGIITGGALAIAGFVFCVFALCCYKIPTNVKNSFIIRCDEALEEDINYKFV